MNTLRSPISVTPPPPARAAVDRHELAEDVALADHQPRLLAPELQVLRHQPDRRERKDLGAVADLGPAVDDRRRADACSSAPIRTCGADHGVRADRRARRRSRADGCTIAVGSISPPVGHQAEQQLAFGDDLIADDTRSPAPRASDARRRPSDDLERGADRRAPPAAGTSRR